MDCCNQDAIIIVRNNDTDFNGQHLLSIRLDSDALDLADLTATFTLVDIEKTYDDLTSGVIVVDYSASETADFPLGILYGQLNIISKTGKIATITNRIAFKVVSVVDGDAIAVKPYEYTINVEQGGENILNITVEAGVSVEVGTTTTLPAGSDATVTNSGTPNHLVLDFGIPRGEKGDDGAEGPEGPEGPAGKDAKINGYNSIALLGSNGVSVSQNGSETIVSGETLQEGITNINDLIPTQATEQNQLADKAFVNSSINNVAAYYITSDVAGDPFATRAALVAGPWYFRGELRQPTQNDYALVSQDETHEDMTSRFMYDGNQWVWQYTLNNTQFTQAQIDAINSGITSSLVTKIGTNESKIGNLSSLSTSVKSDLVSALNEVNTSASGKVSDVQINGTSITTGGVANVPLMSSSTVGVAKLGSGLQINNSGELSTVPATNAQILAKSSNYAVIPPVRLDYATKVGLTTNTITMTDAEKKSARNWQGVANAGLMMPDLDEMTPIKTIEFNTDSTDEYEVLRVNNNADMYDTSEDAKWTALFRITCTNADGTTTNPPIYSETDVLAEYTGIANGAITGVMFNKPTSSTEAYTGIQVVYTVYPKNINNGYPWVISIKAYNQTARKIKVEVFKASDSVVWNEVASTYTYDSGYQNKITNTAYTSNGPISLGTLYLTVSNASTANNAAYLSSYLTKIIASNAYMSSSFGTVGNSLCFNVLGGVTISDISDTTSPVDCDFGMGQTATTSKNAGLAYTVMYQKHMFTPVASLNVENGFSSYSIGDRLYARFHITNGLVYSDNLVTGTPTAGYTWYCIGIKASNTQIYFDSTESFFFTLNSEGKLTHVNGRKISTRDIVTDTDSTTITLANAEGGTDYHYGTLTSLTVTANDTSADETNIYFTAGSSISVSLPNTLKFIGSTPTFSPNKQYVLSIANNILISGEVS